MILRHFWILYRFRHAEGCWHVSPAYKARNSPQAPPEWIQRGNAVSAAVGRNADDHLPYLVLLHSIEQRHGTGVVVYSYELVRRVELSFRCAVDIIYFFSSTRRGTLTQSTLLGTIQTFM